MAYNCEATRAFMCENCLLNLEYFVVLLAIILVILHYSLYYKRQQNKKQNTQTLDNQVAATVLELPFNEIKLKHAIWKTGLWRVKLCLSTSVPVLSVTFEPIIQLLNRTTDTTLWTYTSHFVWHNEIHAKIKLISKLTAIRTWRKWRLG